MNELSSETYLDNLLKLPPEHLAASLVHDLRNKVNGILAGASVIQMVVGDASSDTCESAMTEIKQTTDYILEYTKEIMVMLDAYLKYDDIQQQK